MSHVYTRDIIYTNDRLETEMAITRAEHERMRSLGMNVISYVVELHGPHYAQMHSEFVTGARLDRLPHSQREREIGAVALAFHRYYQDTKDRGFPYVVSDITQPFQFMHGTTEHDPRPQTYLIDVEPSIIDVNEAIADPEGHEGLRLATELFQLREWAEPHWQQRHLPEFPYEIPSEAELERIEALNLPWRC